MSASLFALTERVTLVTGGNGGLGLAIARGLLQAGADVAVVGRDETKNHRARGVLGDRGMVLQGDVTDEDSIINSIRAVVERFGRLDVLVNNAGGFGGGP